MATKKDDGPFQHITLDLETMSPPAAKKMSVGEMGDITDGYETYYERSTMGRGKAPPPEGGELAPLALTSVTVMNYPLGLHTDTIDTADLGQLAWVLSAYGNIAQIGGLLMNGAFIRGVVSDLLPEGNLKYSLKPATSLLTFEMLIQIVVKRVSQESLAGKGVFARHVIVAFTSLIRMLLAPAIQISQSKPITFVRVNKRVLPTVEDLETGILALNVKRVLDEMVAEATSEIKPGSYGTITQALQIGCARIGETLIRTEDKGRRAGIALQIASWALQALIRPGFPDELRSERSLMALTSNATIMLLAFQEHELRLPILPSTWHDALNDLQMALSVTRSMRTITMSEYQSAYGHFHLTGAANRLLAVVAYGNLPGSGAQTASYPISIGAAEGLVELVPADMATRVAGAAVSGVLGASGVAYAHMLVPYIHAVVMEEAKEAQDKSFIGDTRFDRIFMSQEELELYALSLTRTVIPVLHDKNVQLHYLLDGTMTNAQFATRQVSGLVRTTDPREVIAIATPREATASLTTQTDTLPKSALGTVLFKEQIPTVRRFNAEPFNVKLDFLVAGAFEFTITKFLNLFYINPGVEIIISDPVRTRYLLEIVDRVLVGRNGGAKRNHNDIPQRTALAIKGHILYDWSGGTSMGMSVFEGLVRRAAAAGAQEHSAAVLTNAARVIFQLESAVTVGAVFLRGLGLANDKLTSKWRDELLEGEWAANRALSSSPKLLA